jgi:hypothetical protein
MNAGDDARGIGPVIPLSHADKKGTGVTLSH